MRTVLIAIVGCAFLSGCGGSPEERYVDLMNDIADEIEDVTDVASARAAARKLESLGAELQSLSTEIKDKGGTSSPEVAEKMMTAAMRIGTAMQKLQKKDSAAFRALSEAMSKIKINQ